MEKLGLIAKAIYKDGLDCSREELKALVSFVEDLIKEALDPFEEFNDDYDYFTAKHYLEKLVQKGQK